MTNEDRLVIEFDPCVPASARQAIVKNILETHEVSRWAQKIVMGPPLFTFIPHPSTPRNEREAWAERILPF